MTKRREGRGESLCDVRQLGFRPVARGSIRRTVSWGSNQELMGRHKFPSSPWDDEVRVLVMWQDLKSDASFLCKDSIAMTHLHKTGP